MAEYGPKSVSQLPVQAQAWFNSLLDSGIYDDSPYLNGMVCVALATGIARHVLRGRYIDVGQDLEDILAQAQALKDNPDLYMLHTTFLGGLPNAGLPPGGYPAGKERFEFPGF